MVDVADGFLGSLWKFPSSQARALILTILPCMHKNSQHCTPLNWQYWSRYNSGTIHLFWREKDEQLDFQHADKHILEHTPSLIALKCYLCSMKWRTHSNLMVSCNVVPCASCAQKRELIKLFFIRQAGRRAGWQWRHIFELRHNLVCLFIIRHVTNMWACEQAM